LSSFAIARDAERRAAAYFGADKRGILEKVASPFAIHHGEAAAEGADDAGW
jgi:hypothetical protein